VRLEEISYRQRSRSETKFYVRIRHCSGDCLTRSDPITVGNIERVTHNQGSVAKPEKAGTSELLILLSAGTHRQDTVGPYSFCQSFRTVKNLC
jgi:hypothetical protein